jgi:hypothetical protein
MNWRHVLGLFAGVVSGFFLTVALGIVWAVVMVLYYLSKGLSGYQAATQMDAAHLCASLPCLLATLGMGAFALLIGGLIAGWIARTGQVMTGLATGIVSTVISIPFFFWYPYPAWYDVACVVVTIGPAAMGGYLARVLASLRRVPLTAVS